MSEDVARGFTTRYMRRLLLERHHVYAKLHNPGGSIILTASALVDADRDREYSSQIGSDFHLDLIEMDKSLRDLIYEKKLSKDQVASLLAYMDGFNASQAAEYLHERGSISSIRKRRERGVRALTEKANANTRGTSRSDPEGRSSPIGGVSQEDGDHRSPSSKDDSSA